MDINARNLETLMKVHTSLWLFFPIITFKPIVKSCLNEPPFSSATGNQREWVRCQMEDRALPHPKSVSIVVAGVTTWKSSQKSGSRAARMLWSVSPQWALFPFLLLKNIVKFSHENASP